MVHLPTIEFKLHWIQELKLLNKWWKGFDLQSKLPTFFRERTLESWVCALICYFEPHFSVRRIIETKLIAIFFLFDDACDEYSFVAKIETLVNRNIALNKREK